ncbi:MAG: hypothetical protein U1A77_16150 [Pirellulales bacterium]
MRSLFMSLIFAMLASVVGPASAAEFEQFLFRDDGVVLLSVDFNGVVRKRSNVPWDARRTKDGDLYYQCWYQAKDANGKVVNEQVLTYFPDNAAGDNTDASNQWVYWYNMKTQVIWGRCPTKNHPNYQQWLQAKGPDLWQVVPKDDRPKLKGELRLSTVGPQFSPQIIGLEDAAMPKVEPTAAKDAIICIDLENAIFS